MLLLVITAIVLSCKIQASASSENYLEWRLCWQSPVPVLIEFPTVIAFHHCESFITYTTSLAIVDDIMDWFCSMPGNN